MITQHTQALPERLKATLLKSPSKGGRTYVVWPDSLKFFGTRGLVRCEAQSTAIHSRDSFMALGDGTHNLPVKAAICKDVGDSITVLLNERI
jgi:hypothetical protein